MPSLSELINPFLERIPTGKRVYIGYSGGVDSHVLLHLCAAHKDAVGITAVYIHHGLQAEADLWAQHCQATAQALGVDCLLLKVNAKPGPGESPEEAARNARYAALKALLAEGDVLMLAQHREDQLETVLLQLFRGAGLRGLSGMPEQIGFGRGMMLRPLLQASKPSILDYAVANQLHWVEDPSNQQNDYDRNFLRNAVLPLLKQRWPACDKTVARSAIHCADAQALLTGVAAELLGQVLNPVDQSLHIPKLLQLPVSKQPLVIREWFQSQGLKMPAQAFVQRIFQEVVVAQPERDPILAGKGYSLRRYRQHLYIVKTPSHDEAQDCQWPSGQTSCPVAGGRILHIEEASAGLLKTLWQQAEIQIKYRYGGETIRLPGRQGHHQLKKLYQEAGIPPWQRAAIPLVYLNGQLAAVGDYWISADFYASQAEACICFSVKNRVVTVAQ